MMEKIFNNNSNGIYDVIKYMKTLMPNKKLRLKASPVFDHKILVNDT